MRTIHLLQNRTVLFVANSHQRHDRRRTERREKSQAHGELDQPESEDHQEHLRQRILHLLEQQPASPGKFPRLVNRSCLQIRLYLILRRQLVEWLADFIRDRGIVPVDEATVPDPAGPDSRDTAGQIAPQQLTHWLRFRPVVPSVRLSVMICAPLCVISAVSVSQVLFAELTSNPRISATSVASMPVAILIRSLVASSS